MARENKCRAHSGGTGFGAPSVCNGVYSAAKRYTGTITALFGL